MKIFCLFFFLWSQALFAKNLEINPDHSKIFFEVDYMKMTTVVGQFKTYNGSFIVSNSGETIQNVKVEIKTSSIDTSNTMRDMHMKGHEFFFSSLYPNILFSVPGIISLKKLKKVKVKGQLTIRGIKKTIEVECLYKGTMIDPWKKENYFFEISGEINRQDFGLNWNKSFDSGGYLVGDKVRLKISIQAQVSGEKTSSSTHMIPDIKKR